MSRVNQRYEIFIKEMILHGDQVKAYQTAYPKAKPEAARVSSYKLLQIPTVAERIRIARKEIDDAAFKAQKEEAIRLAKKRVADEVEIDAVLSDIVLGNSVRNRKVVVWNRDEKKHQTVSVQEEPDETNKVAAARLLYQRKGSFAEKKIKHEAGDSFIELMKQVTARKKQSKNVSS